MVNYDTRQFEQIFQLKFQQHLIFDHRLQDSLYTIVDQQEISWCYWPMEGLAGQGPQYESDFLCFSITCNIGYGGK